MTPNEELDLARAKDAYNAATPLLSSVPWADSPNQSEWVAMARAIRLGDKARGLLVVQTDALNNAMVGGNHLATIIGAGDHPPYVATFGTGLSHYGSGPVFDVWCAWRGLMLLRDAVSPFAPESEEKALPSTPP
jgi:hypothetical protein